MTNEITEPKHEGDLKDGSVGKESWLCDHEELNSDPQNPGKKPGMVEHVLALARGSVELSG